MAIRVRVLRGTLAQIQAQAFPAGQLTMATDTQQLYMHDGSTLGGILVGLSQAAVQTLINTTVGGLDVSKIQGLQAALDGKASAADLAALNTALSGKASQADLTALTQTVAGKVSQADIDSSIAGKANQSDLTALATTVGNKANTSDVNTALAAKADQSAVDSLTSTVGNKANSSDVTSALALKADKTVTDQLRTDVDAKATTASVTALATTVAGKANTSDVNTALAAKVATADLFDSGIIKASLLPSYVDDVLEFSATSAFPNPGETGKIYVALDTNKIYRWSGTTYIDLASPAILATASDAEATALTIDSKAVTPKNLAAVIAMLGFTQDGSDWVLDEGQAS